MRRVSLPWEEALWRINGFVLENWQIILISAMGGGIVENKRIRVRELADHFDQCAAIHEAEYRKPREQSSGMLADGVMLHHDNAHRHITNMIMSQMAWMRWEGQQFQSDAEVQEAVLTWFPEELKGQQFQSDAEVQEAVLTWFPEEWYASSI
ncbi:hypothetical protein QE152_g22560 [Popillia japonica]|uniref:Transposase n=1 Tax=Popillia japonica TaxID=7064 RepID=A0AAW1KM00_POPJA